MNKKRSAENSGKTTKKVVGRPFKSGESGNPGGRPKDEVGPLARAHTGAAIKKLVFWMRSKNSRASVAAAMALLDRGWGKPAQQIESSSFDEIIEMMRKKYEF